MQLRDYQIRIIDEARALMQGGVKSMLITSPCGSGKTVLTAHILNTAAKKGMASLFIVHRRELIKQSVETFKEVGIHHGVIASGWSENPKALVQIASVQTLARRIQFLKKPRLIVWDECHHCAAASWNKIHEHYNDAYHIGLSATPIRMDRKGLGKYFKEMICGPSVRWLIDNDYLSDYKIYAPSTINTSGVHILAGDFNKLELANAADKPSITGDAIAEYKKLAMGKRAVVFCVSIQHSKHVVEEFNKAGIMAAHIDGETDTDLRDYTIGRFRNGEIKVLSNVDLVGEGFDLPALEVAILLRPTRSPALYLQQIGRALRPFGGKTIAIILDHAGNAIAHGLPDDDREWSLDGLIEKKESEKQIKIKTCPLCYAVQQPWLKVCKYCGHEFEGKPREVEKKEGDLVEVDIEKVRAHNAEIWKATKTNELWQAKTREQLIELGKARNYKRPRQDKKLKGNDV